MIDYITYFRVCFVGPLLASSALGQTSRWRFAHRNFIDEHSQELVLKALKEVGLDRGGDWKYLVVVIKKLWSLYDSLELSPVKA